MLHRVLTECEDCNDGVRVLGGGDLDWIRLAQVMALWRDVVNTLMYFRGFPCQISDSQLVAKYCCLELSNHGCALVQPF